MGYSGPPAPIPIPPSEASPEELYKLRYLGAVSSAERQVPRYGDWRIPAVAAIAVVALVVGALVAYGVAMGSVRVEVTGVSATVGTCVDAGGFTQSTLVYSFTLTNAGTRNAIAALDFYAAGELVDTTWYNPVAAGHSMDLTHSVVMSGCSPVSATVAVRSVTPA